MYIEGGGVHVKQTEMNKGGRGLKTGIFKQTYFLNDPFRKITHTGTLFEKGVVKILVNFESGIM